MADWSEGVGEFTVWEPDYKGNLNLPEEERVRFTIKVLGHKERADVITNLKRLSKGAAADQMKYVEKVIKANVQKIENLTHKGQPITTADELILTQSGAVVDLVFAKITEEIGLSKDQEKN